MDFASPVPGSSVKSPFHQHFCHLKKPFGIDLSKNELLLPRRHLKTFTGTLRDAPGDTWNDEENELVRYFLKEIDKQ